MRLTAQQSASCSTSRETIFFRIYFSECSGQHPWQRFLLTERHTIGNCESSFKDVHLLQKVRSVCIARFVISCIVQEITNVKKVRIIKMLSQEREDTRLRVWMQSNDEEYRINKSTRTFYINRNFYPLILIRSELSKRPFRRCNKITLCCKITQETAWHDVIMSIAINSSNDDFK